jgi:hypothetical protein
MTMGALNYVGTPFLLLEYSYAMAFYKATFFYGFVVSLGSMALIRTSGITKKAKRIEAKLKESAEKKDK